MQEIEELTSDLCDRLMMQAAKGDLGSLHSAVSMIVEYAGYEIARHGLKSFAIPIFSAAVEIDKAFAAVNAGADNVLDFPDFCPERFGGPPKEGTSIYSDIQVRRPRIPDEGQSGPIVAQLVVHQSKRHRPT